MEPPKLAEDFVGLWAVLAGTVQTQLIVLAGEAGQGRGIDRVIVAAFPLGSEVFAATG
jgi:hypothetical protein